MIKKAVPKGHIRMWILVEDYREFMSRMGEIGIRFFGGSNVRTDGKDFMVVSFNPDDLAISKTTKAILYEGRIREGHGGNFDDFLDWIEKKMV